VGSLAEAHAAAQQALEHAESIAPWERALIDAMSQRYPAHEGEADRDQITRRYAEAMGEAARAHVDDLDVLTLHAEALMMFRPWNLFKADGEPYAETTTAIETLETVLAEDLGHAGACHLYIHAVEAYRPGRAEACADGLAEAIPGVSHIQHMPSHIYMNIGRYGDAVRANQKARMMDQAARFGQGVSVYPAHNTLMLVFAAWMDGQSGVALSAVRDIARERPADAFQYHLQLARFGRWDELLGQQTTPEPPFQEGMWHFARGMAQLRNAEAPAAEESLERLRDIRDATAEDATYHFFRHSQRDLLGMAEKILAGELAAKEGRLEEARQHLREAIALEDGLAYSEPEPGPVPARHFLGAVLLGADEAASAETVYREALEIHPDNGWSLKGLAQSLARQGRDADAARVEQEFEQAWRRADVWLPASRF
jgi:tetratricopeptide (TPR) repeat protein